MKAKVLIDRRLVLGDTNKFVAKIQVLSVQKSERYPQGIKAKFVLLNTVEGTPRLPGSSSTTTSRTGFTFIRDYRKSMTIGRSWKPRTTRRHCESSSPRRKG